MKSSASRDNFDNLGESQLRAYLGPTGSHFKLIFLIQVVSHFTIDLFSPEIV
jgi:hypothetical protein